MRPLTIVRVSRLDGCLEGWAGCRGCKELCGRDGAVPALLVLGAHAAAAISLPAARESAGSEPEGALVAEAAHSGQTLCKLQHRCWRTAGCRRRRGPPLLRRAGSGVAGGTLRRAPAAAPDHDVSGLGVAPRPPGNAPEAQAMGGKQHSTRREAAGSATPSLPRERVTPAAWTGAHRRPCWCRLSGGVSHTLRCSKWLPSRGGAQRGAAPPRPG